MLEEDGILSHLVPRVLVLIGLDSCRSFRGVYFDSTGSVVVNLYVFTGFGRVCLNWAVTRCGVLCS